MIVIEWCTTILYYPLHLSIVYKFKKYSLLIIFTLSKLSNKIFEESVDRIASALVIKTVCTLLLNGDCFFLKDLSGVGWVCNCASTDKWRSENANNKLIKQ